MAQPNFEAIAASLRILTDQVSLIADLPTNGVALANRVNALEQCMNQNQNIILQRIQANHNALMARIDDIHWNLDQKIDNVHQNLGARIDNVQQDLGALYLHVYLIGSFSKFCAGTTSSQ